MSVGAVAVKVALDDPGRRHLGPQDPVTGTVVLTFIPGLDIYHNKELFAPLKISVDLAGRSKTKIFEHRSGGQNHAGSTATYRGRVPLFNNHILVHDGKCKMQPRQPQSFPFQFKFPPAPNNGAVRSTWKPDPAYNLDPDTPPSMSMTYRRKGENFECFIEYTLSAHVDVPGIDIKILHNVESIPVLYGHAPTPPSRIDRSTSSVCGEFYAQNETLLREENRPKGFKQKAKALWSSDFYPTWRAEIQYHIPRHLYLNQGIPLKVSLRPRSKTNNAEIEPEIRFADCEISLIAKTVVRSEKERLHRSHSHGEEVVAAYRVGSGRQVFSEKYDFCLEVTTGVLPADVVETFAMQNLARTYEVDVKLRFVGAGTEISVKRRMEVVVHSGVASDAVVAGPPSEVQRESVVSESLPGYADAPVYEDVMNSGGEATEKSAQGVKGKGPEVVG